MFVFMLNSLRVMLVAQDKQQSNYQSVISVLYAIPFTRDSGTLTNGTEACLPKSMLLLHTDDFVQIWAIRITDRNNRKMVIEITGLKPLWLFFFGSSWHLMQHVSNVLVPMACFIQLPPDWVSRLWWGDSWSWWSGWNCLFGWVGWSSWR